MDKETVYIYSLVEDCEKPFRQCDLLFLKRNEKLRWLMLYDGLRSCCPTGPEYNVDYNDFDDFLNHVPHFKNIGFNYKLVIRKSKHHIGEYYSHVYRPVFSYKLQEIHPAFEKKPFRQEYDDLPIIDRAEYIRYIRQLEIIMDELTEVFKVVEPSKKNCKVYGNALRNIIILACTEVDAMMRNIMKSNGYTKENDKFSTNDYIKLKDVLKIDEYELSLCYYETLGTYAPFECWDINKPTSSISWYDAYNKIKHDRDHHFKLANLKNAIYSVTAFAVVVLAQYGWDNPIWKQKFGNIFKINNHAKWEIEDFYIPFSLEVPLSPVHYPNLK